MQLITATVFVCALVGAPDKCPISGKDAKDDVFLDVNGKKVSFCCNNCLATYSKKISLTDEGPKKCCISGKDSKAETKLVHQKAESIHTCCNDCAKKFLAKEKLEVVDKGPAKCPLSGKDATAEQSVTVNGEKIYFCCGNCRAKHIASLGVKEGEPGKCPISNEAAKKETFQIRVKSEALYFCCNNCRGKYIETNLTPKKDAAPKSDKPKVDKTKFD